jgi:hypothetical protein
LKKLTKDEVQALFEEGVDPKTVEDFFTAFNRTYAQLHNTKNDITATDLTQKMESLNRRIDDVEIVLEEVEDKVYLLECAVKENDKL